MANAIYGKGREAFAGAQVDWDTDDIRAILVRTVAGGGAGGNSVYTVSIDVDEFLSTIPNNAYCRASTVALGSRTQALGVLDAADGVWTSVATGDAIQAIVIYKHTGTEGSSRLLLYIDTATGLPVTPNGANVTAQWDNGANKIVKL